MLYVSTTSVHDSALKFVQKTSITNNWGNLWFVLTERFLCYVVICEFDMWRNKYRSILSVLLRWVYDLIVCEIRKQTWTMSLLGRRLLLPICHCRFHEHFFHINPYHGHLATPWCSLLVNFMSRNILGNGAPHGFSIRSLPSCRSRWLCENNCPYKRTKFPFCCIRKIATRQTFEITSPTLLLIYLWIIKTLVSVVS